MDFRVVPSRPLWRALVHSGDTDTTVAAALEGRAAAAGAETASERAPGRASSGRARCPVVGPKARGPPPTDPYGAAGGYYAYFARPRRDAPWQRAGLRPEPDQRVGFPFAGR